jgi:sugar/nucleoside kinase (ribokinase family)
MSDARGVLSAGSLNYDIVVRPVEAPQWGTTTFVDTIDFLVGGNGANTSLALATLGVRTRLAGSIGNDDPARYLLGKLAAAGVDTSGVVPCERPTSATIVMINGEGNRKFLNRPGSSQVAFEEPVEFHAGLVEGMGHFHMASLFILPRLRHSAPETLRRARAAGLTTSLDTTWDPLGEWMAALEGCLPGLEYLFMNEDEARMVTGSTDAAEAARVVLGCGVRTAVMKLGARGSAVYTSAGEVRVPAFDVRCVDTTGAGDCYVAGFLSALMRGGSHEEAARLGNALGALVVEQVGAVTGVRNLEDTLAWMNEARYLP